MLSFQQIDILLQRETARLAVSTHERMHPLDSATVLVCVACALEPWLQGRREREAEQANDCLATAKYTGRWLSQHAYGAPEHEVQSQVRQVDALVRHGLSVARRLHGVSPSACTSSFEDDQAEESRLLA